MDPSQASHPETHATSPLPPPPSSRPAPPPGERRRRLLSDDDCDLLATRSSEPSRESEARSSSLSTSQTLEARIRFARQMMDDSTVQRNMILEFLLRLQSAHSRLAAETHSAVSQIPQIRLELVSSNPAHTPPQPIEPEDEHANSQPDSYHAAMLSRLARLSQRTRDVMQDIDRRRAAAGMSPIHSASSKNQPLPTEHAKKLLPSTHIKPSRVIRLEQRLLVAWSPYDLDLYPVKLPSLFETRRVVVRRPNHELIDR